MLQGTIITDENTNVEELQTEEIIQQSNDNDIENAEGLKNSFGKMFSEFANSLKGQTHKEKVAKNLFENFSDYINSEDFDNDLEEKSKETGVSKENLIKGFFGKVLSTIGKALGIVVSAVGVVINTAVSLIDTAFKLLSTLLHSTTDIITSVGTKLSTC